MKNIVKLLKHAEELLLVITFSIMVLSSFGQVINRNLIGAGISWFEELSRYCMVYMALLAAEIGLRDGTQIAVTALTERLPQRVEASLAVIARLIVTAFSGIVFFSSFDLIRVQILSNQVSPAMKLPMVVPYMALPLSFGIIFFVQGALLLKMIIIRKGEI